MYWPKGGNVDRAAHKIGAAFGNIDLKLLTDVDPKSLPEYDLIIAGGSTVGAENWEDAEETNVWAPFFLEMEKGGVDLSNTAMAFFGLGDQVLYPDHFVDGMGILKEEFEQFNPKVIGRWHSDGYDFTGSFALDGEYFAGLALDEDQQDELTDGRVKQWVEQIKKEASY